MAYVIIYHQVKMHFFYHCPGGFTVVHTWSQVVTVTHIKARWDNNSHFELTKPSLLKVKYLQEFKASCVSTNTLESNFPALVSWLDYLWFEPDPAFWLIPFWYCAMSLTWFWTLDLDIWPIICILSDWICLCVRALLFPWCSCFGSCSLLLLSVTL